MCHRENLPFSLDEIFGGHLDPEWVYVDILVDTAEVRYAGMHGERDY